MKIAGFLNALTLAGIVGVGAYQIEDARAEQFVQGISQEDRYCLQQNIFFEARNQSTLGQTAVAWVTLNRVESTRYPDTICEVVWQQSAFSWTADGISDRPSDNVLEQKAWKEAGKVTNKVLKMWASKTTDPTDGADHYHADYVDPYWADHRYKTVSIDDHVFYRLVR